MVKPKVYQCLECGLHYLNEALAKQCEAWCKEYKSCNLDITKSSTERTSQAGWYPLSIHLHKLGLDEQAGFVFVFEVIEVGIDALKAQSNVCTANFVALDLEVFDDFQAVASINNSRSLARLKFE